eukprot:TRINITY_DN1081_c0_g2_i1.p1 TRINITY_DN1081_c0_g2~~TRINITY_DN1081_c0_g2_i1.p1  ORF type:complete len:450 (+),score=115.62 TRINITY_DN1081_c0_g2_i1:114-1352(+)
MEEEDQEEVQEVQEEEKQEKEQEIQEQQEAEQEEQEQEEQEAGQEEEEQEGEQSSVGDEEQIEDLGTQDTKGTEEEEEASSSQKNRRKSRRSKRLLAEEQSRLEYGSRNVTSLLGEFQKKLVDVDLHALDPRTRCVDIRPVHDGELPRLEERILKMGYLRHFRIVVIKNKDAQLVIVDGRHRVLVCKALAKKGRFSMSTIPAILLHSDTPTFIQHRLATGLNQVAETVVLDTPYDRLHVLQRILHDWRVDLGRPTAAAVCERARLEYGEGVLQVGTVSQYLALLKMASPEAMKLIEEACVGIAGISAGKNHIYNGLLTSAKHERTIEEYFTWLVKELRRQVELTKEEEEKALSADDKTFVPTPPKPPRAKLCKSYMAAYIRWERQMKVVRDVLCQYRGFGGTLLCCVTVCPL